MQKANFLLFLFFARCIHVLCPIIQKGVWIDGISEQRYILAMLRVFAQLPPERREAVRALIACLAETPEEGRALFGVLVQQKTLEAAAGAAGVSPRLLSRLRKKFLEQMPL